MSKTSRPKPPKPRTARKLAMASLRDLRSQWRKFIAIIAIVTVPLSLLNLLRLSSDPSYNAYTQIAAIIMNVALIWAIVQYEQTGTTPRARDAYHGSSEAFLRFLLSSLMIVLMFIPAALAAALYITGFLVVGDAGTLAEQLILIVLCLIIAAPSAWMLVRYGMAPTITVASGHRPFAAMRLSRRLTLGRFWKVFGRYAGMIVFIALTAIPIAIITAAFSYFKLGLLANMFFGLVTTFTALPLLNLYLLKLYRSLEEGHPSAKPAESEPAAAE